MCKCKYMKKGECTNVQSLFKGYNAVWCCVCNLKEPIKCVFEESEGVCAWNLPDGYTTCKGAENCRVYEMQVRSL